MKIGMWVDTYLPIMGGAEIHVLELSRALKELGHEVQVVTAVAGEPGAKEEFPAARLPGLAGGGWRAFVRLWLSIPRLVRLARQVDFIHCHYSFLLAAAGTLLGRILGKPTAVTLHGLGTLDSSVEKHPLWRVYRFVALKLATTIIATSEEMRQVALRFAPDERIVIIPNGVDTGKFTPQPKDHVDEIVMLTMRRLAPKNGVQYLIEAAPQVIAAVPQARLWVAGEGKLEPYLRQRIQELGIQEYVRWIGIVPHEKTGEYYRQADILAFPSSAESTSLACLEAMSMEKAIAASALAAYRLMLGEDERGLLVGLFDREDSDYNAPLTLPPERIEALAEALIRLGRDPELRRSMGRAARVHAVAHYDWRAIARRTEEIYE